MKKINVAVIGASGYTGLELIKLLQNHPNFTLSYIGTSEGGGKTSDLHPSLLHVVDIDVKKSNPKEIAKECELAFLALPHKTAMDFAKELLELGIRVIDLSADYRLSLENYEKYYGKHLDEKHLKDAVYGLPEINREKIKKASLVANPGCYPTASILALLPFKSFIKENTPIFIDAKSGVSGRGKKITYGEHFVHVNENFISYNALEHRHEPEIAEILNKNGIKNDIHFVPHLLPITRGMLINAYIQLKEPINAKNVLTKFYEHEKFVRIRDEAVSIKMTAGTNFCDIFAISKGGIAFVSSSIDNLLRGASAQALTNANLMFGFDEDLGVPKIAYVP
ncbi:MAG: N-acetyl-gamma-glutamyl-phosphate reductase [Campylobacteraceae bacterium]|jgi:N-acetyl-gamma-glutamyl-phosphate reductase|nr:N-acetyl-gamma-glutamyl-phosphate reductase [Campylobacteraceae bacterium]